MQTKGSIIKNLFKAFIFIFAFITITYFVNTYGVNKIKENIGQIGEFIPLGIFSMRFISIIIPALPSTAYSLLSGALLGFKKGLLVICLADLISCSISFYLSRKYGRSIVRKIVGDNSMKRIENFSKNNIEGNFFLMTGILMTGLFDFFSYAIGLTKTSFKKFLPALFLSIILSNPPIVGLGSGVLNGGRQLIIFALIGIFLLSIISAKIKFRNLN